MSNIWERVKAAALWVWNWITVLVATVMGVLSEAVQYIDQITGLDWSQVLSRERVALMVFWTAVVKGIVAAYNAQKAKTDA
jgi:hypothetical protein